ncbi:MAG: carboxypeptidase M32 [Pseudomonadota bacterium]
MSNQSAYAELMEHNRRTVALGQVSGLVSWDQEVMMPARGQAQRSEQAAALGAILHARVTDPAVGDWIAQIDVADLDGDARVNVTRIARDHRRASAIPARLAEELARLASDAHGIWINARKADDFAAFAPTLERMISLRREEAACVSTNGQDPYDALLDDYEPDVTSAELSTLFDALRPGLVDLRAQIAGSDVEVPALAGQFPKEGQLALAHEVAGRFGYDWSGGRLDLAVHPFSSGAGGDVRITTRVDEANPFDCLYSTIHETGHAVYSQNHDPKDSFAPVDGHAGMGVHESQSRSFENQIGRSRAFVEWLYPRMREVFGDFGTPSADVLYAQINAVHPGFIRTEADEVHYNLHVMLRFDLERALIAGDLTVGDLEAAWNDRFAADFGQTVPKASLGVLQDVHWSAGLFGYFPTYTLGNIYAGCLTAALRAAVPDLDDELAGGDMSSVTTWMNTNVHRVGTRRPAAEIIAQATGETPTPAPLLTYLDAKFGELYGV